jgi:serine phosphatase RsbU (regulator of sigma subunit)
MPTATLGRLLDPDAVRPLLDAALAVLPRATIVVCDADGVPLVRRGPAATTGGSGPSARRSIAVDGESVGQVEVAADGAVAADLDAVASLLASALALAASEATARRSVTAAALDDLRELSLLSRLAETIGAAVDPDRIAGCVLETIARPLRADVAVVLPADRLDGSLVAAALGDPGDVDRLVRDASTVLARLRGEDPIQGTCVDLDRPADPAGFPSIVAAVLRTTDATQGALVLGRRAGAPPFDDTDRRLVASVASETAVALERASLQRQIANRRRLDDELAIGRRIQRSLMPRRFPSLPGWEIAAAYEAAREIGGDLYDAFLLRNQPGRLAFVVADVTGKGIPAAILMADTRALLHAAADWGPEPAEALSRVNRILVEERAVSLFVTVALGVVDAGTGELILASAGHDPVHVLRTDGSLTALEPTGRIIGMTADIGAHDVRLGVAPGDAIVAHTDGITEARSPAGAFYGEDRLKALLTSLAGRPAAEIVDTVIADVAAFRAGSEPNDDLTLLVVRRQPV